jgi:formate dehydrogenase gamma subunit
MRTPASLTSWRGPAAAVLLGLWFALPAAAAEAISNSDCLVCHSDNTLTRKDAAGRTVSLFVDEAEFKASVHGTNTCVSCHGDLTSKHPDDNVAVQPVLCGRCHQRQSESYGASVHGLARKAGNTAAARCSDCHGSHAVLSPDSPASPLHWSHLAATCGKCHPQAARDVRESVHGRALREGRRDAPTCTDCHSEHKIEQLRTLSSVKLAEQICGRCHASERLNTRYDLPGNRVTTFLESYHGLAAQFGSTRAANCASCHGYHLILPSSDPRSSVNKRNLVHTCGKCHPGANANFSLGTVHLDGSSKGDLGDRINYWVRGFYLFLIFGVVGSLLVHNLLAWGRKAVALRRRTPRTVLRMTRSQRVQHLALLLSFTILAVTGFALKYPDSWVAWLLGSDELIRRWSHRLAGVLMLGLGVFHLVYVIATREGRQLVKDLWPTGRDGRDLIANARILLGGQAQKPKFGRFGYPEKFEYWAVVWGTIIMGVTGLVIWLKLDVTQFLPRWIIDVATTVHYYEAILACLAIIVWHLYHVIFDPEVYPLNWAWWDGKVSADWYHKEHPLDPSVPETVLPALTPQPTVDANPHPTQP